MRSLKLVLASAVLLATALAPYPSIASTSSVTIADYSFTPKTITINKGDSVLWTYTSSGQKQHTVTADDNSFGSGTLNPGGTYKHKFDVAGTFNYHCSIHPTLMTGTVKVLGPSPTATATPSKTSTPTPTPTHTATRTPTPSRTPSASPSQTVAATQSSVAAPSAESQSAIALSNKSTKHSSGLLIMILILAFLGLITWRILKRPRLR
ncbi:MAG: cupredoxin domain-containing protein [Actinomycetota bacterium]